MILEKYIKQASILFFILITGLVVGCSKGGGSDPAPIAAEEVYDPLEVSIVTTHGIEIIDNKETITGGVVYKKTEVDKTVNTFVTNKQLIFKAEVKGGKTFTEKQDDPKAYTYIWSFGQDNAGQEIFKDQLRNKYVKGTLPASNGFIVPYEIKLVVLDARGERATAERYILFIENDTKPTVTTTVPKRIAKGSTADLQGKVTSGNMPFNDIRWEFNMADGSDLYDPHIIPANELYHYYDTTGVRQQVFDEAGDYKIIFRAKDGDGDEAFVVKDLEVYDPANEPEKPNITIKTNLYSDSGTIYAIADKEIKFSAGVEWDSPDKPFKQQWHFDDGLKTIEETNSTGIKYLTPGTKTVRVVVTDAKDRTGSKEYTFNVESEIQPKATIGSGETNLKVIQNENIDFKGNVQFGNRPFVYEWNFGQGAVPVSSTATTAKDPGLVRFTQIGRFTTTFKVSEMASTHNTNNPVDSNTATVTIDVQPDLFPHAKITGPTGDIVIDQGTSYSFQGVASGGNMDFGTEYQHIWWDFDGAFPKEEYNFNTTKIFNRPGNYTVSFNVKDDDGDVSRSSVMVTVRGSRAINAAIFGSVLPAAPVSSDVYTINVGQTFNFEGFVEGGTTIIGDSGPYTYEWDLDHDLAMTFETKGRTCSQRYTVVGDYIVRFRATDALGATSTDTVTIRVEDPIIPYARIDSPGPDVYIRTGESISFLGSIMKGGVAQTSGYIFSWDLDGDISTIESYDEDPGSRPFNTSGYYYITFTATDETSGTRYSSHVSVTVLPRWESMAGGSEHTLAIGTDGTLWAWGNNSHGQLGVVMTGSLLPVQVGEDRDWAKVSAGIYHSAAVKDDGTLWTWGSNTEGQLGLDDYTDRPWPTLVGGPGNWVEVECRQYYTTAIKSDHTLWTWGINDSYQLGDTSIPSNASRPEPAQIGGPEWLSIAPGICHVLAIKTDHTLWAWGVNNNHQLGAVGYPDTYTTPVPIQIAAGTTWLKVAAGDDISLAIRSDGTLWQWGKIVDTVIESPQQIGTDTTWTDISVGYRFCMAQKSDTTLWVWGENDQGQLGTGNTEPKRSPVMFSIGVLDDGWSILQALPSSSFVYNTTTENVLSFWVWGYNVEGQLGIGTTDNQFSPKKRY